MPSGGATNRSGFVAPADPEGDIIIPAHNEEAVIARCLDVLNPAALGPQVRVIVACNGCTDATADIARTRGVEVVEVGVASKPAALRAAEASCRPVSRVYLDADVELAAASARAMLNQLARGCLAARPAIEYVTAGCGWSVRRYYSARRAIPSIMTRLWGAGVYGLAPEGRDRFGDFPDVTAEDFWVDLHFSEAEICILSGCPPVRVHAPRNASDLRRVLRRSYRGPAQLRGRAGMTPSAGATGSELLAYARRGPGSLLDAAVYSVYALGARTPGLCRNRKGWERDESTRSVV